MSPAGVATLVALVLECSLVASLPSRKQIDALAIVGVHDCGPLPTKSSEAVKEVPLGSETALKEVALSGAAGPGVAVKEVALPGTAGPEDAVREVALPGAAGPEDAVKKVTLNGKVRGENASGNPSIMQTQSIIVVPVWNSCSNPGEYRDPTGKCRKRW